MSAPISPEVPAPGRVRHEPARLRAADGYLLAADVFAPAGAPRAAALVAPAMGVRRGFYAPLARYLAEAGVLSLSLDYRGTGDSRPASLRGFPARLRDWGERDLAAGVGELFRRAPGVPLLWVVRPADLGVDALGHFEPLRERFRDALWREVREWLLAEAAEEEDTP